MRNRQVPANRSNDDTARQSSNPTQTDPERTAWELGAIRAAIRQQADITHCRLEDAILTLRGFLLVAGDHEDVAELRAVFIEAGAVCQKLQKLAA